MKNIKKKLTGLGALVVAVTLIAAVWAYFTSTSEINNELHTKEYGSRTIETFTPQQDMQPGQEIEKKVGVTNTGGYDLVVRIKLDEEWSRNGEAPFKSIASTGAINTVTYSAGPPPSWTAVQPDPEDGKVSENDDEETVIYKKMNHSTYWKNGGDGYYYYTAKLEPGKTTAANFMESVIPASNIDMGKYIQTTYYSTANKKTIEDLIKAGTITEADYGWITVKPQDHEINFIRKETLLGPDKGYAAADYKLIITTEVCQATAEAVAATWTMNSADLQQIKQDWDLPANN